jgi:sugar phosphate isomerase/epimerase
MRQNDRIKLSVATTTPEISKAVPVSLLAGSFSERTKKASKLGYEGVELLVGNPHILNQKEIRTQIRDYGLEVAAVSSGAIGLFDGLTLLSSERPANRQAEARLVSLVAFASFLDAPLVTIGGFRGRLSSMAGASGRGELIEILGRTLDSAQRAGVRLVLEPLNRYESDIINTTEECLKLIEEVNHTHLGLLIDTFHANIEEPSFRYCIEQGMKSRRLWHIHVGDSNRLAPGEGHIDFGAVVTALREFEYEGYCSAELDRGTTPDERAEAAIKHLRQFIPKSEEGR